MEKKENPYGYCPICGAPGYMRERCPDGNDTCTHGHLYPSRDALPENFPPLPQHDIRELKPGPAHPDKVAIRIEALRAASRIVAGGISSGRIFRDHADNSVLTAKDAALCIAKTFVKFIEGE